MAMALLLLLQNEVLQSHGIEPDAAGVVAYLDELAPTAENCARAEALVRQLGDESFDLREEASAKLRRLLPTLRVVAGDAIETAAKSNDVEIQSRVRRLMREASMADGRSVLRAALTVAGRHKAPGTVAAVLPLIELVEDPGVRRDMRIAVRDAAAPADEATLRDALKDGPAARRAVAVTALGRMNADVTPLLDDPQEEVRLAAARALLDRGDPAGLEPLAGLLASEQKTVAREAAATLHRSTGKHLDSQKAWLEWIRADGATAKLSFPLPDHPPELGRTLITLYSMSKIVELDRDGKVVLEKEGISGAFACQGLPNGHRLVAGYSDNTVYEYDADGNEVWRKDGLPGGTLSVQRLENGNTMVACGDSGHVLEVAPDKSIVRDQVIDGRPTDVTALDDGRWLVTLYNSNRVVEIDGEGREVWSIEGLSQPFASQRLENGNTLICEVGARRVVEYDRAGGRVWAREEVPRPYHAQRLESGNTLVVDFDTAVIEYDAKGEEVGRHAYPGAGRVCRY